ncbi:TonB-dependent receptor [Desulfosarcina sp.]|nr:TonB-dependent receptor [Desulfosarcina sp.]
MKTLTNNLYALKFILLVFVSLIVTTTFSQEFTQTIKGKIVDVDTEIPLPGATVVILGTDPLIGASADVDGYYRLDNIPLGRYNLHFSYMGFEPASVTELEVGSGKQVIVNMALKEAAVALDEVVVTGSVDKKEPLNSMAIISTRQINMEEAHRYAGAFDDPSRLASSYAGVAGGNMNSNGIVIRGNAPKGVLWRMEGLEIANPSHFANLTTFGGGGVTALSSQMIDNSDFYTAAFPAEFGNALSGVFDLKMRTGNRDKREYAVQVGLTGLDVSAEGPFKKGKGSTYLFNYRYSMFGLIEPVLPEDAGLIKYQDLSFKTEFPTKKAGVFSMWGIASSDYSGARVEKDPEEWTYDDDRMEEDANTYMGAFGVTHKIIVGKKSYVNSSLALSGNGIVWNTKEMDQNETLYPNENVENYTWKYSLSSYVNHKFSNKHTNRTGVQVNLLNYDILTQQAPAFMEDMTTIANDNSKSELLQAYSQSRFDLSEKVVLNAGLHAQYFTLNNKYTIEPRLGIKYRFQPNQTISFGYGLHSRLEMLFVYLGQQQTESGITRPNTGLDFSKSHHFVVGYDRALTEKINFRAEVYYQHLFSTPVEQGTSFSLSNTDTDWFINQTLVNEGTGQNYGLDLTLERFMNNGYYYMFTASVFNSEYVGGDGITRDSRFNKNFVFNVLGGKEWKVGRGHKNNSIGVNGKFSVMGGDRVTPVDEGATFLAKEVVYDEERAFENQNPTTFYAHFTINYRKNKRKHASIWSFQILNAFGAPEYFGYRYNYKANTIDRDEQTIVIPNISYKIVF